jgi:hypothetical protein
MPVYLYYQSWTSPNGTEFCPGGHYYRSPLCRFESDARSLAAPTQPAQDYTGVKEVRVALWGVEGKGAAFPLRVFLGWIEETAQTLYEAEGAYQTYKLIRIGSQYFLTHEHYGLQGGDPKRAPEPTRRLQVGEARAWLLEQGMEVALVAELVRE